MLDYQSAFMSVPSSPEEQRHSCCLIEEPLRRERSPLDSEEPTPGTFIAWHVLGLGGRPYP